MVVPITNDFSPAKFLAEDVAAEHVADSADLLILNQPIAHFDAFARLWKHTGYRICADGGANRLFDMFKGDLASQREGYVGRCAICSKLGY
jgi:thiamine pyrophosphokinase